MAKSLPACRNFGMRPLKQLKTALLCINISKDGSAELISDVGKINRRSTKWEHRNGNVSLCCLACASWKNETLIRSIGARNRSRKLFWKIGLCDQGWGFLKKISATLQVLQNHSNVHYPLIVAVLFGRCRCTWAAVAPVKYMNITKDLAVAFLGPKISRREKWTNGALVTPAESYSYLTKRKNDLPVPHSWTIRFFQIFLMCHIKRI